MRRNKSDLPSGITQRGAKFRVGVMVDRIRTTRTYATLAEAILERDRLRCLKIWPTAKSNPVMLMPLPKKGWTLDHAFAHALSKPASDGGWQGARWEPDVRRIAAQLKSYFGAGFSIAGIRRAQADDGPRAKTIDGFIKLCRTGHFATTRIRKDGERAEYKPRENRNGTINRKLDVLKKALRLAVAFKALDKMPAFPPRPREPRKKIRFFSVPEERELLAGFRAGALERGTVKPDSWLEAYDQMVVLIDVGLRWGELDAALPGHFYKSRRELYVPGIEDSGQQNDDLDRVVPLTARAFEIFERRCEGCVKPFALVYDGLSYRFDKLKEAMGLKQDKRFTIHTARHTFCSRLAQAGVESATIKDLAGHKNIATTLRYIHLNTKSRRAAIDAMETAKSEEQ